MTIDLNADAGESFGAWKLGNDEALFPFLSSVNLACGFHAGDPLTIRRAVRSAKEQGVAVGAHPGFPDRVGFGRRDLGASPDEIYSDVVYQLGALLGFLKLESLPLHHVKAHGALYSRTARDAEAAGAVAGAVAAFDADLPLVVLGGPGGAVMRQAAEAAGLITVTEAFPDRAYLADGRLVPRAQVGAVLDDPAHIVERAVALALGQALPTLDGGDVTVSAQTLCLHGDNPNAPQTAQAVRRALEASGIAVATY